jgi:NitT/TauT family transport system substrate-binding protein
MNKKFFLALTLVLSGLLIDPDAKAADTAPIPIRFAVILSAGQGEVPYAVQQYKLDQKYGLDLQIVDYAAPGQQYTMLRGGAADVTAGNFVDLLRQRKASINIQAFHSFKRYSNVVTTKPDSPIKTLADLRGKKLGEFGTTFLDWLILRAAALKADKIDLEKDTSPVPGAPPLLNQLLAKDSIDAALQFAPLTLAPVLQHQQRIVTDIPTVMKAAGFDADSFYLQWDVTEDWVKAHPGMIDKVYAMIDEAYQKLQADDAIWTMLAQKINITDPALVAAYRDNARATNNPPYRKKHLQTTQTVVDAIIAIAGDQSLGITKVDPAAFLFPAGSGS